MKISGAGATYTFATIADRWLEARFSPNSYTVTLNPNGGEVNPGSISAITDEVYSALPTFATRGLENGIPLKVMQELLGHANISMTADTYSHVLPDTKRNEVTKNLFS